MRRWAFVTVFLYLISLVVLTAPLVYLCFRAWPGSSNYHISFREALETYHFWGFWLWAAVMIAAQALLLLIPVDRAERRPTPRRSLWVPALAAGLLMANVVIGIVLSIVATRTDDKVFEIFGTSESDFLVGMAVVTIALWSLWALIFRRFAASGDPDAFTRRLTRWLLRGSILELLVAVPCHVIVRRRGECCAPGVTFWGITSGLSVMILSFGPGVFFLFAQRFRRLRPRVNDSPGFASRSV